MIEIRYSDRATLQWQCATVHHHEAQIVRSPSYIYKLAGICLEWPYMYTWTDICRSLDIDNYLFKKSVFHEVNFLLEA